MGMAPLALYLKGMGWSVSGHDDHLSPQVRAWLDKAEIPCEVDAIPADCSLVVHSSAISAEHPLHRAARARGLRLLRRGECLAECVRERSLVAIVGSHGKTTTTAMVVHLLERAGVPFSYLIGGLPSDTARPPARFAADSPWVVSEIDESDGTIEYFSPAVTVALNFDWDHPDQYRDETALERMFADLFRRTSRAVVVPEQCERLRGIAQASAVCEKTVFSYAEDFNQSNARAALAAAHFLTDKALSEKDLQTFRGIRRRQDVLLARPRLKVVADYAHHPTEIAALLKSLKKKSDGHLWAVFQPHRFTRTRQYAANFGKALPTAELVFLLPVYAASEPFLSDGTHAAIVEKWPKDKNPPTEILPAELEDTLLAQLNTATEPVTLVFVGAGDIDVMAAALVARLEGGFAEDLTGRLAPETLFKTNEPLANKTTFRIGGAAKFYAEPATLADLAELVKCAGRHKVNVFVLGRGSNLLVPDEGFDGLVIRLNAPAFSQLETLEGDRVRAGAGARLKELCGLTATAGLSGFEAFEGIPACVGGALRMNAGAMGGMLHDRVETVDIMDFAGQVRTLGAAQLHPRYRCCPEVAEGIAIGAVFKAQGREDPQAVRARMDALAAKRKASQPREPSAGCVFQNPQGDSAGRLIDAAGLKGETQGGALVSPIHGNFIVNAANAARCADVLALMKRVRARVNEKFGKTLEPEVRLLGKDWKDVL